MLVIESGSRELIETFLPRFQHHFGTAMEVDLVTCYTGRPAGFEGRVYSIADYRAPENRGKLFQELAPRKYDVIAMLCSAEPIMTKWKWSIAFRLDAKVLIINENVDFFWLDRSNWRAIVHFVQYRAGMTGAAAIPTLARLLFFPVTLAYLMLFAGAVHFRRWLRVRQGANQI